MAAPLTHLHHRKLPLLSFLLLFFTFLRAGATTASTSRKRRMPFIIANSASGRSSVVNRSLLLAARKQPVMHYEQSSHRFRSLSSFCGGSTIAFCTLHSTGARRLRTPSSSFQHQRIAYSTTFPSSSSMISSLYAASSSADNYYTAASSISKSLSTTSTTSSSSSSPPSPQEDREGQQHFPSWWPITESMSKYITFSDHIAHVIIPSSADSSDNSGEICEGMTCGQVIDWVLQAARSRKNNETTTTTDTQYSSASSSKNDHDHRLQVITNEWKIGQSISTSTTILDPAYRHDPNLFPQSTHYANNLTSADLLAMGSVWSLPYKSSSSSYTSKPTNIERDRFDPSNGIKPTRLTMGNYHDSVSSGDYFRVHFNPRRFVDTNLYDWSSPAAADDDNDDNDDGSTKPGVIIKRDDETGYLIINKPPNIPVHARVDNLLENVASSVGRMLWLERRESLLHDLSMSSGSDDANDDDTAGESFVQNIKYKRKKNNRQKQKMEQLVYVATPQRLDQNTSGLLVVSTKKSFASYFAKLLRTKTSGQLESGGMSRSSSCGVHKSYRCLVCVSPKDNTAMASEVARIQTYQAEGTIIKHFLEPSIRAPKKFVESIPDGADNTESYAECLLKITNITNICTVVGNAPSDALALNLWGKYGKPVDTVAILELEIELLTGRTHQIRGQMAALGFPLVGDVQYGGAIPNTASEYMKNCRGRAEGFLDSETLALQCSTLEFLAPDVAIATQDFEKVTRQRRSDRWLSFHLDGAFWTPFIESYHGGSASLSGSSMTYEGSVWKDETSEPAFDPPSSTGDQVLPPLVQLSQGRHKYVVIRATSNPVDFVDEKVEDLWFVRSASPEECGGEYHADVARELLNQLKSLGYTATVMGGGRIDFFEDDEVSHAHVFGFSYGFGKGDHEKVTKIIEEHTSIIATFDMSDGLY